MPNKNIPTGYANSKRRVIFTSAAGKPYVRTEKGEKSYQPKAKFAMNSNGSTRVIQKANLNKVPAAIRPKRAPAKAPAKKAPNAFKGAKKAASPSKSTPSKTVRMTPAKKASPSMANTRAYLMNRGYTKRAAAKVAPMVKKGMPSSRYSKTTGMVKGKRYYLSKKPRTRAVKKPNSLVKRSLNIVKTTARKPVKRSTNIIKTAVKRAMSVVKPRKSRANKGKPRALVASPGGRLYKGRAALTRKQRAEIKKNAIAIANSIKKMLK